MTEHYGAAPPPAQMAGWNGHVKRMPLLGPGTTDIPGTALEQTGRATRGHPLGHLVHNRSSGVLRPGELETAPDAEQTAAGRFDHSDWHFAEGGINPP